MDTFIKKAFSVLKCTSVSTVDLAQKGCLTATIINHLIVKAVFYLRISRTKVKSRMDFFLVAKSIACQVAEVGTKISIAPEHKAVKLRLNLTNSKRDPSSTPLEIK